MRRFLAPLLIAVAGVAVVLATDDVARIVGWGIFSIAAVIAVSLVFLEVGLSEDRERERSQQARRGG